MVVNGILLESTTKQTDFYKTKLATSTRSGASLGQDAEPGHDGTKNRRIPFYEGEIAGL